MVEEVNQNTKNEKGIFRFIHFYLLFIGTVNGMGTLNPSWQVAFLSCLSQCLLASHLSVSKYKYQQYVICSNFSIT